MRILSASKSLKVASRYYLCVMSMSVTGLIFIGVGLVWWAP